MKGILVIHQGYIVILPSRYGASLGGSLCNTSKMYAWRVQLTSHESETTQKAQKQTPSPWWVKKQTHPHEAALALIGLFQEGEQEGDFLEGGSDPFVDLINEL
jgi:hypothetical protein